MTKKSTSTKPSKAKNAQKESISKKKVGRPKKDTSSHQRPAKVKILLKANYQM